MNFNDDGAAGLSHRKQPVKDNNGFLDVERAMTEASHTETTKAMQSRPMYHVTNTGQRPIWEVATEYNQRLKRLRYTKIDSTRCM